MSITNYNNLKYKKVSLFNLNLKAVYFKNRICIYFGTILD